jgi:hypothetical protein
MAVEELMLQGVYHDVFQLMNDGLTKATGEQLANYKTSGFAPLYFTIRLQYLNC